jgi:CDP-diacylglycerol pyrophosphatase
VAIRDVKMCGCAGPFVHGLAMPRAKVGGVEDARRPAGIWAFAWDAARARIGREAEIGLAVNPRGLRTQDHLHVHLVRLKPEARTRLGASAGTTVDRLDAVWDAAARQAAASGMDDYGVLVTRAPAGGFLVVAYTGSPEDDFTDALCR